MVARGPSACLDDKVTAHRFHYVSQTRQQGGQTHLMLAKEDILGPRHPHPISAQIVFKLTTPRKAWGLSECVAPACVTWLLAKEPILHLPPGL